MIILIGIVLGFIFFAVTVGAMAMGIAESRVPATLPPPKEVTEKFWCLYCERDFHARIRSAAFMPQGRQEIPDCPFCLRRELVVTDDDYQERIRDDWAR